MNTHSHSEPGKLVRQYVPPTRKESFGLTVVTATVAIAAFWMASEFNHTWAVPVFGVIGVTSGMMAVNFLFKSGSRDPVISIYENGLGFGRTVLGWKEIASIDYRLDKLDHHHGLHSHISTWTFNRLDKSNICLSLHHVTAEGDYLSIEELNAHIAGTRIPFEVH